MFSRLSNEKQEQREVTLDLIILLLFAGLVATGLRKQTTVSSLKAKLDTPSLKALLNRFSSSSACSRPTGPSRFTKSCPTRKVKIFLEES